MKCWFAAIARLVELLAGAHGRQAARLLVVRIVVVAFLIDREEAVELHHRAGGAQLQHARGDFGRNVGGRAFELGRFHLACDRAQPNELVESGLVGIEEAFGLARPPGEVGRTDGFVRFLRVLGLGLVAARRLRHVFVAEIGLDHAGAPR